MPISYPLSLPDYGIVTAVFGEASAAEMSQSPYTFKQQIQVWPGDAWTVQITLPPLAANDAAPWLAFLSKLNGIEGTFLIGDRSRMAPRGVATGTPLVKGAGQSGKVLVTDGWTSNITGILRAGDHISIENRLYKILNDSNSDGSGNATFDIWPRLRAPVADNAPITTSNPLGTFRLLNRLNQYSVDTDRTVDLVIYGIEAR